jgi:hypothetical protein
MYRTTHKINEKLDYLVNNLGKEQIDTSKFTQIRDEMEEIQEECRQKFENLKRSTYSLTKRTKY